MAQVIGETTLSYLGKETLRSAHVFYFSAQDRAIVWVELVDRSFDAQLAAVSAFADVRDCYAEELELELRFGVPASDFEQPEAARAVVHAA